MDDTTSKPLTPREATQPASEEPSAEIKAWQDAKVRAAIKAADAGDFATPEELTATIGKYLPNG